MARLIKLTASALYVPDDELEMFTSIFNCSPEALGSIDITVSDEAYLAVQNTLTTDSELVYWLECEDAPLRETNCILIKRGLISAQSGRFDVIRAMLSRVSGEPRIDLFTYNGQAHWWLSYRLKSAISIPVYEVDVPNLRFRITQ